MRTTTGDARGAGPCRVLCVDHGSGLGGAEHSLLSFFDHVDRARVEPVLASCHGALADEARRREVTVHELDLPRLRRRATAPWHLARGAAALTRIVRADGIDVLYANTQRAGLYAGVSARISRRPMLWHIRDLFGEGVEARLPGWFADATVAVSSAAARSIGAHSVVIPNGVVPEVFDVPADAVAALRTEWSIPNGVPVVGQIARLAPWKGQLDTLEMAHAVLRHEPDVRFVIVGGDVFGGEAAHERTLRERIRSLRLDERVVLVGHRSDVPVALALVDVLVHTSRSEPFGRILVEAAAAGVPVVAYRSGGVPEIVDHLRTGLLVDDGDVRALTDGVLRLVRDRDESARLGRNASHEARQRFDVRVLTRELENELVRLAGGDPGDDRSVRGCGAS